MTVFTRVMVLGQEVPGQGMIDRLGESVQAFAAAVLFVAFSGVRPRHLVLDDAAVGRSSARVVDLVVGVPLPRCVVGLDHLHSRRRNHRTTSQPDRTR